MTRTTSTRTSRSLAAILAAGLLAVSACGSSDEDADSDTSTEDTAGSGDSDETDDSAGSDDTDVTTGDADDASDGDGATTLVVSQPVDIGILDPQLQTGTMTDMNFFINLFDYLTVVDDNGEVQPGLATSWEAVDDTTWRFELREGVTFHNGEEFNAETAKYTFDRMLDPELGSPLAQAGWITEATAVDEYTLDIGLGFTDPYFPAKLSLFFSAMLPKQYIEENGNEHFADNPVGTGPFQFVSWERGDRVTLAGYENYWDGAPAIDELVIRNIPSTDAAIAALRAGEVDLVSGVEPDAVAQFDGSEDAEARSGPGIRTFMLSLDADNGGPLEDVRVRQALNHAVDVDLIIETLMGGYALRTATPMPNQSEGIDPSVTPYEYDPEKARELLAEAGYPDGFETKLTATAGDATIAQALVAQLGEVGVDVELETVDPGTFEQELISPDAGNLGPLFVLANTPWTLTPWSAFDQFVPSEGSMSRFTNEQADEYWNTILTDLDPAAREDASKGMQQVLKDEAAFLALYQIDNLYAVDPALEWEPNVIGLLKMHDADI